MDKIDFYRFTKEELKYEIKCRKITIDDNFKIEELRNIYKDVVIEQKLPTFYLIAKDNKIAQAELLVINQNLNFIEELLNSVTEYKDRNWEIIATKFKHYSWRINNTVIPKEAVSLRESQKSIVEWCEVLKNNISKTYQEQKELYEKEKQQQVKQLNIKSTLDTQSKNLDISKSIIKMAVNNAEMKTPKVEPPSFEGRGSNVEEFIEDYNLCANLNNWTEETKTRFLPYYLKGAAKVLFRTEQDKLENWQAIEKLLLDNYKKTGQQATLQLEMYDCCQKPHETTGEYIANKISLINKVNIQMPENEKANLVIFGLLPEIAARVASMPGNNTVAGLKENIRITEFSNIVTERAIKRVRENGTVSKITEYSQGNEQSSSTPKWAEELVKAVSELKIHNNKYTPHNTSRQGGFERQQFNNSKMREYRGRSRERDQQYRGQRWSSRSNNRNQYGCERTRTGKLITCFTCKKPGHIAKNCWKNSKNEGGKFGQKPG